MINFSEEKILILCISEVPKLSNSTLQFSWDLSKENLKHDKKRSERDGYTRLEKVYCDCLYFSRVQIFVSFESFHK